MAMNQLCLATILLLLGAISTFHPEVLCFPLFYLLFCFLAPFTPLASVGRDPMLIECLAFGIHELWDFVDRMFIIFKYCNDDHA